MDDARCVNCVYYACDDEYDFYDKRYIWGCNHTSTIDDEDYHHALRNPYKLHCRCFERKE